MAQKKNKPEILLCGIDEAGRGPLAGPVAAACVFIPSGIANENFWTGVRDSKKLSAKKREELFTSITEHTHYGLALSSAQEIDELNIHHASLLAMRRAFEAMVGCFSLPDGLTAQIDGKFCPDIPCPAQAVVGGDDLVLEIGAASILAKVTRDRIMSDLHREYPHYGWDTNAGYGTAAHKNGLHLHGITPHHRKSYAPVREAMELKQMTG